MAEFRKLLAVIDPTSEQQPAMERAAWLAGQTGARLELFICYYNQYLSGDRFFDSRGLKEARAETLEHFRSRLEGMAERLRADGLTVVTDAAWDNPLHEGIVRKAVATGADVVFKDTHYHKPAARVIFTNTDWNLIRTCPMALWLVKPGGRWQDGIRYLAAVDPMHEHEKPAALDDQIINTAKRLAGATGGEVHTFHSYDPIIAVADAANSTFVPVTLPVEELEAKMHERHRQHFNELLEFHGLSAKTAHLVAGRSQEVLPALARDVQASVVIMGAVARNRLKRIFIGSTAEEVMDNLPCDLLVLKPAWFETPVHVDKERSAA